MKNIKKRNGFTLVELLAVIVVLAIIMVIAVPSVLNVMNDAKKALLVQFASKSITTTTSSYSVASMLGGDKTEAAVYVYNVRNLGMKTVGDYKGFVVVDATDLTDVHYHVYVYDKTYVINGTDAAGNYPESKDVYKIGSQIKIKKADNSEETKTVTTYENALEVCQAYNGTSDCIYSSTNIKVTTADTAIPAKGDN